MIWWTFTDPAARSVLVDWEPEAKALLARLRAAANRHYWRSWIRRADPPAPRGQPRGADLDIGPMLWPDAGTPCVLQQVSFIGSEATVAGVNGAEVVVARYSR